MELVSIIIPIYKVEKYIDKCVRSAIEQSYRNIEIILVDDGSPDGCPIICDKYAETDNRIVVIHKVNGGLSDARNAGIDIANGDYLFFLDSDDWIRHDTIEVLLKRIKNDESDIAICNFEYVNEYDEQILSSPCVQDDIWTQADFWGRMYADMYVFYTIAWNKLYRKSIFESINYPVGKLHEDEFILFEVVHQCDQISIISDKLYYYLQRTGSIMGSGYSIRNLDGIEAYLQRANQFIQVGNQTYAETTLILAIRQFLIAYQMLDMKKKENKDRYFDLRMLYFETYKNITTKGTSVGLKVRSFLLRLSPRLAFWIQKIRNSQ